MAPFAFLPAFLRAISSACGLPVLLVTAFEIILLFLDTIQPTEGFGEELPNDRLDKDKALVIKPRSIGEIYKTIHLQLL